MGYRRSVIVWCVLAGLLVCVIVKPTWAQDATSTTHVWEVFLRRNTTSGADTLTFVDVISGDSTPLTVSGERYTLVGNAVMYYDRVANRVMMVYPDGKSGEHPFIQP